MSLARLLLMREQKKNAYACLEPVYCWFTEGLDTPDLRAARAILSLSG